MIQFVYVLLLFLEAVLLYFSGKLFAKSDPKQPILKAGFLGLFVYTFNEGLRWGRGVDYNLYYYGYDNIGRGFESNLELTYQYVCKFFYAIGLPWQFMVAFMSFVLILSVYIFLKNYREVAHFALPLFGLLSLQAETLMRWYFAFSFILIALSYYLKSEKAGKDYIFIVLFCILGVSIHNAIIFILPILWMIGLVKKTIMHPIFAIAIYIVLGFLFETEIMNSFVYYINLFSLGGRYETYQDDASYWLTRGNVVGETSSFVDLKFTLFWIMIAWFGYKLCMIKEYKYKFVYNAFLIGFMLNPLYHQIELVNRYGSLLLLFQFVVLAYILKEYLEDHSLYTKYRIISLIIILFFSLNFLRNIFVYPFLDKEDHYLYLWDANGRETLDASSYWD